MAEPSEPRTSRVVLDFLLRLAEDRAAGKEKGLSEYQDLYPGFEDVIAQELSGLSAAPEGAGDTAPAPPLQQLGPYRLLRELGHGGQGVVYLAEDTHLHRRVALKVLSSRTPFSEKILARFRREAEMATRLQHPGICTVYDAGELEGMAYIAMQYVEGGSLATKIVEAREHKRSEVLLPTAAGTGASSGDSTSTSRGPVLALVRLMESAARAVHAVHEVGVVHRDLKPGNIVVTPEAEPVILDFGLARAMEEEGQALTLSGDLLGTPAYLAPERVRGQRAADARVDVYGLGATLYECLTLHRPFEAATRDQLYQKILGEEATSATRLNRQVPHDLAVVLQTALEKDPDRRYRTALDFAEDLQRVRSFEPIRAKPAGPVLRARRWTQRNPRVATLLALLVVALLGVSWALLVGQRRLDRATALARVGESEAALKSDQTLALQKAVEAVELREIPETISQLHSALAQHHEEAVFLGHSSTVWHGAVSPRGDRFLTASRDGTLRIGDPSPETAVGAE